MRRKFHTLHKKRSMGGSGCWRNDLLSGKATLDGESHHMHMLVQSYIEIYKYFLYPVKSVMNTQITVSDAFSDFFIEIFGCF